MPECKDYCSQIETKMQLDDTDGIYIYFGFVVAPYIVKTVLEGNQIVIHKIFDFMEQMAVDEDESIGGVLDISILEHIVDRGGSISNECKKYMLENTLRDVKQVEEYLCRNS